MQWAWQAIKLGRQGKAPSPAVDQILNIGLRKTFDLTGLESRIRRVNVGVVGLPHNKESQNSNRNGYHKCQTQISFVYITTFLIAMNA